MESNEAIIGELFALLQKNHRGQLPVVEAKRIFHKLNERLGKECSEKDADLFFARLDSNNSDTVDMDKFKTAFKASQ